MTNVPKTVHLYTTPTLLPMRTFLSTLKEALGRNRFGQEKLTSMPPFTLVFAIDTEGHWTGKAGKEVVTSG